LAGRIEYTDLNMEDHLSQFSKLQIHVEEIQNWPKAERDLLHMAVHLFASMLGGSESFTHQLGELNIQRTDTGASLGLAYRGLIKFNATSRLSAWTVMHELAHTWDAKKDWAFSTALVKNTGGFINKKLSALKRFIPGQWDAGKPGAHKMPGLYGRKPGCNAAAYFYGDVPSGSNWNFNPKEDFAESLVMYCGWGRENELSKTAHGRIERYLLPNGAREPLYGISDNWADYAAFFYPKDGDYTKTKRWQFIHELMQKNVN
jgi:hypothetical protein